MDEKKTPHKQKKTKTIFISLSVSFAILFIVFIISDVDKTSVKEDQLLIATVERGNLDVVVQGFGLLESEQITLMTAGSDAIVKEILLKPGAIVNAGSIVARLENPELALKQESALQELALAKAAMRQLRVRQRRELLEEESSLAKLVADFEAAKLRREAQQTLVKQGIVSVLAFKENELVEQQLLTRIEIAKKITKQLKLVHFEALKIEQEKIKLKQGVIDALNGRLEKLTVKAGADGVLQKLSVTLGQSLIAGEQIAQIGSIKRLIATIHIPQNQIQLVNIGQNAVINIGEETMQGKVARIAPVVKQNTVQVELSLISKLPETARPQRNIEAGIIIKELNNIHYINRPIGAVAGGQLAMYKVKHASRIAHKENVTFGEIAGKLIEITSKVEVGDTYVISDLNNTNSQEIEIL